jgi:hypothetical protein
MAAPYVHPRHPDGGNKHDDGHPAAGTSAGLPIFRRRLVLEDR